MKSGLNSRFIGENKMTRKEYLNRLTCEEYAEFLANIIGDCCAYPVWNICDMKYSNCKTSLIRYLNKEVNSENAIV